jgi:hypothetical protein
MERLSRDKVLKKMKLQSFPSNKVVTLKYVFSDLLGKQKTEKLVFENIIVSGAQNNDLLSSRFLKKAKFTSSDSGSSVISFNIKLYTEKDLENEKFDRNNDSAYLFYKNFLFPKLKDSRRVDLDKIIKGEKINGKSKKAAKTSNRQI